MKKYIHVNRITLGSNKKWGKNSPPLTVKTYTPSRKTCKINKYGHRVEIDGPSVLVYSEDNPLPCGARVWVETESQVRIIQDSGEVDILE